MKKEEMLQEICTSMAYNHEPEEDGFAMLTSTRYTQIKEIPEMYISTVDGLQLFRVTIEEVKITDLPKKELETLEEYLDHIDDLD